jgi:2-polyprenyl-6-methoxyphenol hydroxylase-like FAD-dependent oxidoreductase
MFGHSLLHKKPDDIVQVGLGPTGLAYALEVCRNDSKKRNIIILTDRVSYTRDVVFRLDLEIFEYYRELIGETAYQAALEKSLISPVQHIDVSGFFGQNLLHRVVKIKTAENLLYQQLSKLPQVRIIILAKHTSDRIQSIQRKSNSIVFQKDNRTHLLHYSYLIEADGIHHSTLNLVNDHPYYHTTQKPQTHSHHVRINFSLPPRYTADQFRELLQSGTQTKPSMTEFHQLGWEHQSTPEFRLFVVEDTFYVGGECPSPIQTTDKQKIETWVRLVLCLFLPKNIVSALVNREAATFNVQLDETDNPTLTLSPNHATPGILFLTGEALRKSHYQTGSGAAVGLQEAKAFGEFLKTPQTARDLQKYEESIKAIIAINRVRVDRFLNHRAERELAAQQQLSQATSHQSHTQNLTLKDDRIAVEKKLVANPVLATNALPKNTNNALSRPSAHHLFVNFGTRTPALAPVSAAKEPIVLYRRY